jgi:hypothetical protein
MTSPGTHTMHCAPTDADTTIVHQKNVSAQTPFLLPWLSPPQRPQIHRLTKISSTIKGHTMTIMDCVPLLAEEAIVLLIVVSARLLLVIGGLRDLQQICQSLGESIKAWVRKRIRSLRESL